METTGEKYFLKEVTLSGYKSIKETTIDFQSNLSIIIGKNAAGKTNFLEFLDKVLNYDFESIYDFKSNLTFKGKKNIIIEAQNSLSDDLFTQKNAISTKEYKFILNIDKILKEYDTPQYAQFIESLDKENFTCFSTLVGHGIPDNYNVVDRPFAFDINDKGRALDLFAYGVKLQHPYFTKSILMSLFYEDKNLENIIKTNKNTNLEEIKLRLDKFMFKELDTIKPYLKLISPIEDIRFSENNNVFESKANEKFTISNLFLEFKVNGEWHPFSNLSDGTKRLFYIISEVAFPDNFYFTERRFGKFRKENSRIILIEEPELGIHPHQLHTLMTFLKEQSFDKQIIISTHSPQVLDILNKDELNSIILAYHDNKKGTLLRHLSNKEISKAKIYIKEDFLSGYWLHSDLETTNQSAL